MIHERVSETQNGTPGGLLGAFLQMLTKTGCGFTVRFTLTTNTVNVLRCPALPKRK